MRDTTTIKKDQLKENKRTRHCIDDDNQMDNISSCSSKSVESGSASSKGKRKAVEITSLVKAGVQDPKLPTIRACMQSKKRKQADMAIARWFYDACIPFSAVNSPYFQAEVERIASVGHGYKAPSYHALRVDLLRDAKVQLRLYVDSLRQYWTEFGCTIMGDGWTDAGQRRLINFFVYCSRGLSFIKSVDASSVFTDAESLCNLFGEIVEMVGPTNVVHIVTDNSTNYKAAGKKLLDKYPTIQWSPCAINCINLIMKDIAEMAGVRDIANSASKVTSFVYNRKHILNWLRKRPGWREIVCPGATHFATTFIVLKSLHDQKHDLEALMVSDEFRQYFKMPKGKEVKQIVLDEQFWSSSLMVVKVTTPVMRLLRICASDEPSMGFVYEGMNKVRNEIKELFKRKKYLYKPFTTIIKIRWDKMLRQSLHAAAYWLNPVFQYDKTNFCRKIEVSRAILDVIDNQKLCKKQKLVEETKMFQERLGSGFSRDMALRCVKTLRPVDWWTTLGYNVPNLRNLAVRILSQSVSSFGCERNQSVVERIHTKKRNILEHQRLTDLAYVHYNLRFQRRYKLRVQHRSSKTEKKPLDPIDFESIDETEAWIIEDEQEEELDIDELENMLEERPRFDDDSSSSILEVNEDDDAVFDQSNEDTEGDENDEED